MSKHIHKWVALPKQPRALGKRQYRCAGAECYFTSKAPLLVGKLSLCTRCDREFHLTEEDLKRNKPMCLHCANTKEGRAFREKLALEAAALESEIFATIETPGELVLTQEELEAQQVRLEMIDES